MAAPELSFNYKTIINGIGIVSGSNTDFNHFSNIFERYNQFRNTLPLKKLFPIILLFAACTTNSSKVDKAQPSKDTLLRQTSQLNKPNLEPESKIQTLTLSYNAFSCTCGQWSESKFDKDSTNKIHYWLEPANTMLVNADTLFNGELPLQIQVTGQVANENGYPVGIILEKVRLDEAAKVFIYTKIKVLKNGQKKNGY
ncbi:hypothetical protein OCK74_19730 [Chitinophagaceae bacterium LB-8]|uniref:Uncharacterized protein n=1 Tax=Paraflavisolibacter caeni TaxID=2982496 RepID=A0A9X3BIH4_9BACT|nr:hypothetical protein [Paraflavisolibacter caeni]MCU7551362.1 hypothetical protein [Paraflavisolibacter caeni]